MGQESKVAVIANSKFLRAYLKGVIKEAEDIKSDSFMLYIERNGLNALGCEFFGCSCSDLGEFEIDTSSAKRLTKAIKYLSEQPVKIVFDGSNMNLQCAF